MSTIMLWLIIFSATFLTAKCDGIIQAKILTAFARQFRAPQPLAIFYNTSKETKIKLIKSMSKKGVTLHWNDELTYSKKFLLVITQSDNLFNQNKEIKMDQEIYYLTSSLDLYEKYTVNNIEIKQKLGHFADGTYVTEKLIEQNILKRRQNFHGSKLMAVTNEDHNFIKTGNLKNAPYFPTNETYDVTGLVHGSYFDIWMMMQNNLNFTTIIYRKKVKKYGVPVQHPNGSISVPDGIIKDSLDYSADILFAHLSILYNRYLVIDYMVPIDRYQRGIFINKDSFKESYDFDVFHQPFDKWTWTTLISSSLIVAISIFLTSNVLNQGRQNYLDFLDIFKESLKANFGNASFAPITNKFQSIQMVIFVAMIMGNIIWIEYNGALLSKLIEPRFDKPFQDLESLAKSNYR